MVFSSSRGGGARQNNYTAARTLYGEGLVLTRKVDDQIGTDFVLEKLAGVVAAQGERAWATRLWGAASVLREATGVPIYPVYRSDYECSVATVRTQLGEQAFAAAWAAGRAMTLEQVLAHKDLRLYPLQ